MNATVDPNASSGNSRRMVVSIIALVIGLVGVCICLFGGLMFAVPALNPGYVTSTGRQLQISDGIIAGLACVIPGFIMALFAGGLWFIAGRSR